MLPPVPAATSHHTPYQHGIAKSDQDDGHNATVERNNASMPDSGFGSYPVDTDSSHSMHSHSMSNSDHNSCGSGGYLKPSPLPRYGYPVADDYHYPHQYHHCQYSEKQNSYVPELKIIPPTPNSGETPGTLGTEPFSVPFPGLQHPSHTRLGAAESTQGSPVSREVAVNIAMYLIHKDCPDQENCPTCQLINQQFQRLFTRYEHTKNKDIKQEKLHRRYSVRDTPRSLYPPKLGRQRSQSTAEMNAEELTISSNADLSTNAEVLTEPEGPRSRTFIPLPLSKISRDLLASDSELAVTPSGHIPSPRRTLASPTKIHLKPSTPQSSVKDDRPPSSDSLTTSESRNNSRPSFEGYNLPLTALPPLHSVTLV